MAENDEIFTEKAALSDILKWSEERPAWQRDALRRLVLHDGLTDADIDELVEMCLNGASATSPLKADHLGGGGASEDPVSLVGIENPKGVNALAEDQSLSFAPTGLTIVYGDNGAGKSGYVRVLKRACRTRDGDNRILANIGDSAPPEQSAKVRYLKGAVEEAFDWGPGADIHDDLTSVSIFDSRSANIHVEETNAVAYIPRPMRVLENLAEACDTIKVRLNQRIEVIEGQVPETVSAPSLSKETAAGSLVWNLSAKTKKASVMALAVLSEPEKARLAALESDLSQDPKRAAARLRNVASRLEELMESVATAAKNSSSKRFTDRDQLKNDLKTKKEAAELASGQLFAASPLPDVGKEIWQTLWEAARDYSNKVAYPDQVFPVGDQADDRCVLCQQTLSAEASERLQTFEAHVKGEARAQQAAAREKLQAFEEETRPGVTMDEVRRLHSLIKLDVGDPELASELRRCALVAALRHRAMVRGKPVPTGEYAVPVEKVEKTKAELEGRAKLLLADDQSPERQALISEYNELKDRERLGVIQADVEAQIDRLEEIEKIKKASKSAAKVSVTNKNKELSDKIVTNALRGRFAREVEKLKLTSMPVELRKIRDRNAVSYFRVCLVEMPESDVGEVFSEGEHRCVALAAFLAELVTAKQYSGIVFDDPMSSLDHLHRQSVAKRLVEEAEHRQVVVFTHDLTFLYELRREADAQNRQVHYQTVRRRKQGPGFVDDELPTKAKAALQLVNEIRSDLKSVKGQFDDWNNIRRTIYCKGIIEQLREAWDQGIADFIMPVLGRFDNQIKGSSLYRLAVLTEEDVKTVTDARSRLSEDLHVSAETLNPEDVSHDELAKETAALQTWLEDISKRQNQAQKPVTSYIK